MVGFRVPLLLGKVTLPAASTVDALGGYEKLGSPLF